MADIQVTSTGRKFFKIDNATAALLREAFPESFAEIKEQTFNVGGSATVPIQNRQPRWAVNTHALTGKPQITLATPGGETFQFIDQPTDPDYFASGDPDHVTNVAKSVFARTGWPAPESILEQYKTAFSKWAEAEKARLLAPVVSRRG